MAVNAYRDFQVCYNDASGKPTSVQFAASPDSVNNANAVSVFVPRYKSSNPADGVAWDQIPLNHSVSTRFDRRFSINDRYFDMKAINDFGVWYRAWRPDGSFEDLQGYGANVKPRYIGVS